MTTIGDVIAGQIGREEYEEMVEKIELLAIFAEEIKQTPAEAREGKFGDSIEEAIELAEEVCETLDKLGRRRSW